MSRPRSSRDRRSGNGLGHVVSRFTNEMDMLRKLRLNNEISKHFAAPDNDSQVITEFVNLDPRFRRY